MESGERIDRKRKDCIESLQNFYKDFVQQGEHAKTELQAILTKISENVEEFDDSIKNLEEFIDNVDDILGKMKCSYEEAEIDIKRTDDEQKMWEVVATFQKEKNAMGFQIVSMPKKIREIKRKFSEGRTQLEQRNQNQIQIKQCLQKPINEIKTSAEGIHSEIERVCSSKDKFSHFETLKEELFQIKTSGENILIRINEELENTLNHFKSTDWKDTNEEHKKFQRIADTCKSEITSLKEKMNKILHNHNCEIQDILKKLDDIYNESCNSLKKILMKIDNHKPLIQSTNDGTDRLQSKMDDLKRKLNETNDSLLDHYETTKLKIQRSNDVLEQRACLSAYRRDIQKNNNDVSKINTTFEDIVEMQTKRMGELRKTNIDRIRDTKEYLRKLVEKIKELGEDINETIDDMMPKVYIQNTKQLLKKQKDSLEKQINDLSKSFEDVLKKLEEKDPNDFELCDKIKTEFEEKTKIKNQEIKTIQFEVEELKKKYLESCEKKNTAKINLNNLINKHQHETLPLANKLKDEIVKSLAGEAKHKRQQLQKMHDELILEIENLKKSFETAKEIVNKEDVDFDKVYEESKFIIQTKCESTVAKTKEVKQKFDKMIEQNFENYKSEQKKLKIKLKNDVKEKKDHCIQLTEDIECLYSEVDDTNVKRQLERISRKLNRITVQIDSFYDDINHTIEQTEESDFSKREISDTIRKEKDALDSKIDQLSENIDEIRDHHDKTSKAKQDKDSCLQSLEICWQKTKVSANKIKESLTEKISSKKDCDDLKQKLQSLIRDLERLVNDGETTFNETISNTNNNVSGGFDTILSEFCKKMKNIETEIRKISGKMNNFLDEHCNYTKNAIIKVNKLNEDLKTICSQLLDKLNNVLNDVGTDKYIDKKDLDMKVNDLKQKLEEIINVIEEKFLEEKNKMDLTDELGKLYESLSTFDKIKEKLNADIEKLQTDLSEVLNHHAVSSSAVLARSIRKKASQSNLQLKDENELNIFQLPKELTFEVLAEKLRRFELGEPTYTKEHRHIMLSGMTGSGKSLLINNMVNYIYGVSHQDKFRFKLIVDSEEKKEREGAASTDEAKSMTSWVTSYTFHWQEGFRIPYSLTIIDTPGFGDTRGLKFDEIIVGQIKKFFDDNRLYPSVTISSIGFLIQASQAKLTDEQRYIFDQILQILGKDMTNNIFIIFTFADAQEPPAMEVVRTINIPYRTNCTFKFNNSAVYAEKGDELSKLAWNFGYKSLEMYFEALQHTESISLELTKKVLEERDYLRVILESLQEQIQNGMELLRSIEEHSYTIVNMEGAIKANKDYKVKKSTFDCTMKKVSYFITNCKICKSTCHDPCQIAGDKKEGCAAMKDGNCVVCTNKCSFDMHTNGSQVYVYTPIEVEITVEEMMKDYNVALNEKGAKKKVLMEMLSRYAAQKLEILECVLKANKCFNRLQEISLKSCYLSNVEYIDRVIESEERSTRPHKADRLNQLRHLRAMAETLNDVKNYTNKLPEQVSDYERKIQQKIETIQDGDVGVDTDDAGEDAAACGASTVIDEENDESFELMSLTSTLQSAFGQKLE